MLVLEGAAEDTDKEDFTIEEAVTLAKKFIADGGSTSESAKQAAKITGFKKNEIYKLLMELTDF